jgi:hypothetical protein
VFTANGKTPITNAAIVKAFRRGLAAVEIDNKDWMPYWIRYTFGTYALETLEEAEISALMGNGVTVLRRHYLHPDDETLYRSSLSPSGDILLLTASERYANINVVSIYD